MISAEAQAMSSTDSSSCSQTTVILGSMLAARTLTEIPSLCRRTNNPVRCECHHYGRAQVIAQRWAVGTNPPETPEERNPCVNLAENLDRTARARGRFAALAVGDEV